MTKKIVALVLALSMLAALGGSASAFHSRTDMPPAGESRSSGGWCSHAPDLCYPVGDNDPRRQNDRYHNPR